MEPVSGAGKAGHPQVDVIGRGRRALDVTPVIPAPTDIVGRDDEKPEAPQAKNKWLKNTAPIGDRRTVAISQRQTAAVVGRPWSPTKAKHPRSHER